MEHIIQFAVGIDDERIVKHIEERAEKTITDELKKKVEQQMFRCNFYGEPTRELSNWTASLVESFLKDHKDEIIELAGKHLAEKLVRTKAVKEMIENLKND